MGAPRVEKALVEVIEEAGWVSLELGGGGEDLGSALFAALSLILVESGEELGGFGPAKKLERVACFLEDDVATSAAFRLRGVAMIAATVTSKLNRQEREAGRWVGVLWNTEVFSASFQQT